MLKIDYGDKDETLLTLYDKLERLNGSKNNPNEPIHAFSFLGEDYEVTQSQKDLCLAIAEIEREAEARALEYYSTRPEELADDLKDDIEFRVILDMSNEAYYELIPFLTLLREKAPELHEQVIQFIKDTLRNRDKIMNTSYAKLVIKKAKEEHRKNGTVHNETAIIKRVETFLSPVDKVSGTVFDSRKNSIFYGDNEALVEVGNRKGKAVDTLVYIRPDNLDNVSISNYARLSPYDRAIHDALISIYAAGNTHATIPFIYRTMRGNNPNRDKPEAKDREDIEASIDKLMHSIITIDATKEAKAFGLDNFTFKGQLIPMQYVKTKINGQYVDCVNFLAEPPLLTYAGRKNQINRCDIRMLDVPLNNSEENITIKTYLLERLLSAMNKNSKMNNIIRYDTLYEYLGLDAPNATSLRDKKRDVRGKVHAILEAWKKAGIILGFTEHKEGNTIAKIELHLPNLPKTT